MTLHAKVIDGHFAVYTEGETPADRRELIRLLADAAYEAFPGKLTAAQRDVFAASLAIGNSLLEWNEITHDEHDL